MTVSKFVEKMDEEFDEMFERLVAQAAVTEEKWKMFRMKILEEKQERNKKQDRKCKTKFKDMNKNKKERGSYISSETIKYS